MGDPVSMFSGGIVSMNTLVGCSVSGLTGSRVLGSNDGSCVVGMDSSN